ncbi:hypothetical protein PMAYCL1PPCAC_02605, partial [Pristionchus mayeri]
MAPSSSYPSFKEYAEAQKEAGSCAEDFKATMKTSFKWGLGIGVPFGFYCSHRMGHRRPLALARYSVPLFSTRLDASFAGSEITEITMLQQQEVTLKLANLTGKDVRTIVFGKKEFIVEDIGTPTSAIINKHFMVGDVITKITGRVRITRPELKSLMSTVPIQATVVLKRRAYASVPEEARLRNILAEYSQTRLKGFAYQVITCNKMSVRQEKLVKSTFGFHAVVLGGKFVVVKMAEHSVAEKFFSIGDALLDLNGMPFRPLDSKETNLSLINKAFLKTGEISILIERPVTAKARKEACVRMKNYLVRRRKKNQIPWDVMEVSERMSKREIASFRRITPVGIVNLGHKASPKKRSKKSDKKKKGEKDDDGEEKGRTRVSNTASTIAGRVSIDPKKNFAEIVSDTTDLSELEVRGGR